MGFINEDLIFKKIKLYFKISLFFLICFVSISIFTLIAGVVQYITATGGYQRSISFEKDSFSKIPDSVLQHKETIIEYMNKYEISQMYLPYILAQATQESYGKSVDLFQASESKYNGEMGRIQSAEESIEHAMKRWREIIDEIEKRELIFSVELVLQTYNFGSGYLDWVEKNGKEYTEENAKSFSEHMLNTLKNWKYKRYWDIHYIKNIFRYIDFDQINLDEIENFDDGDYYGDFGIALRSGDYETLENFVSDFGTPDRRTLFGGITGTINTSYSRYGRQCVSWCYNRWFEVHKTNTGRMGNGGYWKDSAYSKGLQVLEGFEKLKVKSGWVICFPWDAIGHIAFIEKILPNGTLIISEQNYDRHQSFRQRFSYKKEWFGINSNYFVWPKNYIP